MCTHQQLSAVLAETNGISKLTYSRALLAQPAKAVACKSKYITLLPFFSFVIIWVRVLELLLQGVSEYHLQVKLVMRRNCSAFGERDRKSSYYWPRLV